MTPADSVVSNSSPLIAFERIGRVDLLQRMFDGRLAIPSAVAREVYGNIAIPPWIHVVPVSAMADPTASPTLGAGEREAITLAIALSAELIILDDLPARRLAARRGLAVIGTVGVLLVAKRTGAISAIAPILESLVAAGFHLSDRVRDSALAAAEE